jgi:hypothetical protein
MELHVKLPQILREPLFHFLLLGFGLFLLYGRVAPGSADQQRIEVNSGRIETLSQQFQSTWSRPPTEQELAGLIDSYVHDEVLYREGLAMGLDAAGSADEPSGTCLDIADLVHAELKSLNS